MKDMAQILRNISQALQTLSEIERKAYNIDDVGVRIKKILIELDD